MRIVKDKNKKDIVSKWADEASTIMGKAKEEQYRINNRIILGQKALESFLKYDRSWRNTLKNMKKRCPDIPNDSIDSHSENTIPVVKNENDKKGGIFDSFKSSFIEKVDNHYEKKGYVWSYEKECYVKSNNPIPAASPSFQGKEYTIDEVNQVERIIDVFNDSKISPTVKRLEELTEQSNNLEKIIESCEKILQNIRFSKEMDQLKSSSKESYESSAVYQDIVNSMSNLREMSYSTKALAELK